ncbi:MAG: phosphate ABC transporter substrate-binding/OmpA family protein [Planctomycetota bacterium]|jgi:outer membrane protein OmpA-like peptidoglycan-associated protein/ABC-type taurine transport system substrate-binding protein
MSERTSKSILVAALVWLTFIGMLAVAYRFLVHPYFTTQLEEETGSESRYKHRVVLALDSFSGYCVLRSEPFRQELKSEGIDLNVSDDGADYAARIRAIRDGDVQLATFTIDSLIASSAELGEFPATIVLLIDETKGADALIARKDAVASIQDLDSPDARIVLTPNSPSEFLARVVLAHFSLPSLRKEWMVKAEGAAEVYSRFRKAAPDEKTAYVLWEPYVTKAVDDGAHILLDSSKLKGYIVDVLVAQREFLREKPAVVRSVVEAYMRAAYSHDRRQGGMAALVLEDSKAAGANGLDQTQAARLVERIQWMNTLENYAHFGLMRDAEPRGVQHLEDMITKITGVLVKTGAMKEDPLAGKASTLFYDGTLAEMKKSDFHPSKKLALIEGMGAGAGDLDAVRRARVLGPLSDAQWSRLAPVGELQAEPISFARGTARINVRSERELTRLAKLMDSWPQYYLVVVGHARSEGDREANLALARERADAAVAFLVTQGVASDRVRAKAAEPSARGGAAQSVSFVLGQLPY